MNATTHRTDWINKLCASEFNYWFGYPVNLALVLWFASYAFAGGKSQLSILEWLFFLIVGYVVWSAIEYMAHRYIYHAIARFGIGHNLHHQNPTSLLGVPWYVTTLVLLGIFYALSWVFDPARIGAFMAFSWFFYTLGCFLHHWMHRVTFHNPVLRLLQKHHLIHHVDPDVNFAVLGPFLDWMLFSGNKTPVSVEFPGEVS